MRVLLHVCCAPCSSHVLETLNGEYEITVFFYNPNITEEVEYVSKKEDVYDENGNIVTKETIFPKTAPKKVMD